VVEQEKTEGTEEAFGTKEAEVSKGWRIRIVLAAFGYLCFPRCLLFKK
jgi:hypothetical protein